MICTLALLLWQVDKTQGLHCCKQHPASASVRLTANFTPPSPSPPVSSSSTPQTSRPIGPQVLLHAATWACASCQTTSRPPAARRPTPPWPPSAELLADKAVWGAGEKGAACPALPVCRQGSINQANARVIELLGHCCEVDGLHSCLVNRAANLNVDWWYWSSAKRRTALLEVWDSWVGAVHGRSRHYGRHSAETCA